MFVRKQYANSILENLPPADFASLSAGLKEVKLLKGEPLFEPDIPAVDIYFPVDSVISFMGDTGEGGSVEVWSVGSEGVAGLFRIFGKRKTRGGGGQVIGQSPVWKDVGIR